VKSVLSAVEGLLALNGLPAAEDDGRSIAT